MYIEAQVAIVNNYVFPLYGFVGELCIKNMAHYDLGIKKDYPLFRGKRGHIARFKNDTGYAIKYKVDGRTSTALPGTYFIDPWDL